MVLENYLLEVFIICLLLLHAHIYSYHLYQSPRHWGCFVKAADLIHCSISHKAAKTEVMHPRSMAACKSALIRERRQQIKQSEYVAVRFTHMVL